MASAFNKPATVLITGIDGFTGRALEQRLDAAGYTVFGTVLAADGHARHLPCDLRDTAQVERVIGCVHPEYVVHLAAMAYSAETRHEEIYAVNVLGCERLLEALSHMPTPPRKVLLASSASVYGNQDTDVLSESMCPKPVNHYGISKWAMEAVAASYVAQFDIVIVRPFNYTGPGQDERFLIPKIVGHYRRKEKRIALGNLDVAREFNSIEFAVGVYEALLRSDLRSETLNMASGRAVGLKEIIAMMDTIAGYRMHIEVNPAFVRAQEIPLLRGSTQKLLALLPEAASLFAQNDLEALLRRMYETR